MLALRKEAEDLRDGLAGVPSEAAVRDLVVDYNARVAEARPLSVDDGLAERARRRARLTGFTRLAAVRARGPVSAEWG